MISRVSMQQADAGQHMPAFELLRPVGEVAPVIFTSPHSGHYYPETFQALLKVPLMDLRRTEDAFVNDLFAGVTDTGAVQISGLYGRCYVDLNRDPRELDARMLVDAPPRTSGRASPRVLAGLGCLPKIGASGSDIYSQLLTASDVRGRLERVHDLYHQQIKSEIETLKTGWNDVFLIDCHSMPSHAAGRGELPDIVLGDRFGSSCDRRLTSLVERTFRKSGYSVVRNAPFAGGYTTQQYGRPGRHVHALQIEINRSIYMCEEKVVQLPRFETLRSDIATLSRAINQFARSQPQKKSRAEERG